MKRTGWDQEFWEPIALPRRKPLRTIRDAALYITRLPKNQREAEYWQPAAVLLRLIGENGGCVFFARLAVMHGLRKGKREAGPPVPRPRRARQYRIIPAKIS
jgi:hypothetical protein